MVDIQVITGERKTVQAVLRFSETKIATSSLTKEFCSVSCCELRLGDIEDEIFKLEGL